MARSGAALLPLAAAAALAGCAPVGGPPAAGVAPAAGPVAMTATPTPPPPAWPDAVDCRARAAALLAMPEAARERLAAGNATLAVAVADERGALLPPAEVPSHLAVDLPLALAGEGGAEAEAAAGCLVLAGVVRRTAAVGGERRLVGHEVVRSEYRSGTRRVADAGRARRASRDDDDGRGGGLGVMRTGDPALDLIGLVAGGLIRGAGRIWSARDEAAAAGLVPDDGADGPGPGPEAAVYRPYTYEVSLLELERAGVAGVALVDRAAGRIHEARHAVRERRVFPLAKGRHAADRGLLERTGRQAVLEADLDLFAAQPPRPLLSDILRALAAGDEGRPGGVAAAMAALARAGADPGDPAAPAAPVPVRTAAGAAAGAWVGAGLLEVPAASLGGSSLVEVTRPDGVRAFGLVERVDEAAGRAVVRVGGPAGGAGTPAAD